MKYLQYIFICLAVSLFSIQANAVPACPHPIEFVQPDGTTLNLILKGDEKAKWAETTDGYTIIFNPKGFYEYGMLNADKELVPSGTIARNIEKRTIQEQRLLEQTEKHVTYSRHQFSYLKSIQQIYAAEAEMAFPTSGNRNLICILMGFKDLPFKKTKTDFNNLFNQVNYSVDGATGSVKDYYSENSYNQLNLNVTVAGPYVSNNNMAYYGGNTSNGSDSNPRALITEAVQKANPDVNYANFDNDNDGSVDGVYVIFAGYGEEAGAPASAIWSHAWSISTLTLDGKKVSRYSCSPELRGNSGTGITRIGVICHEFGHVLGSPDYYDTDYATNGSYTGTGRWDLMSGGSWNNNGATPAHHNAYTKTMIFNWAVATTLTSDSQITLLNAAENSNSFYRVNTATNNEYFLIENRQQTKFDAALPGHGMIIYHVDGNYISAPNGGINAGSHQGIYPVCANATGNPPATYGTINGGGCPFPGTGGKKSFTDTTTPNARSWAGANTNKPITAIVENTVNKTVTFTLSTGSYFQVPGVIQAENYSSMAGVQKEQTTDAGGGENIGYTDAGDYLDYLVNIPVAGLYEINFRVASAVATGKIELRNAAGTTLTTLTQGTTGGWQNWVTKSVTANLVAGKQTLRVFYAGAGLNLNWFEIKTGITPVLSSITVTPVSSTIVAGKTAQFTAVGKDQNGVVMPITPTWSATGGTITSSGLYTAGNSAGNYTVTAKSGTVTGTATVSVTEILAAAIPGKIEAEAYDGMFGIQTQPTTDTGGGENIGYVDAGDWLDYNVNVASAGAYNVSFRVASQLATGAFQLKAGAAVLATVAVPNTGGWQNWQTVTVPVTLAQGAQTLRIAATGAGLNINWMDFVVAPNSLKIEAESYTSMFGIQTETTTDAGGGLNVGWTEANDWMNYTVNVPSTGAYAVNFRVASLVATGKIELRNGAGATLATLTQGSTGGWQTWITKGVNANLTAGSQTLRIYYTGAGLNFNWFELVSSGSGSQEDEIEKSAIAEVQQLKVYPNPVSGELIIQHVDLNSKIEVFNMSGKLVMDETLKNGNNAINVSRLSEGMYVVKASCSGKYSFTKFIRK